MQERFEKTVVWLEHAVRRTRCQFRLPAWSHDCTWVSVLYAMGLRLLSAADQIRTVILDENTIPAADMEQWLLQLEEYIGFFRERASHWK